MKSPRHSPKLTNGCSDQGGVFFDNRRIQAENTPGQLGAHSVHCFDIRVQFTSVRPIFNKLFFLHFFSSFSTYLKEALWILNNTKKKLFRNNINSRKITS